MTETEVGCLKCWRCGLLMDAAEAEERWFGGRKDWFHRDGCPEDRQAFT